MKVFTVYCELCSSIAKNFYNEYKETKDLLNKLCENKDSWDLLSHSDKENELFNYYWSVIRRNTVSIIVFEALAVESYINLYGYYYLKEKFDKKYEYKPTLIKICDLCEDVIKTRFPKGEQLYCQLFKLFRKRDELVHFKADSIDVEESTEEEFIDFISKYIGSTSSKELDEYIEIYDELRKKMKELEGCEIDFIDRQKKEVYESMTDKIAEMYSFQRYNNCETE